MLSYRDMDSESVKPVMSKFTECESNHEIPSFSINVAKDFRASVISGTGAIQDL